MSPLTPQAEVRVREIAAEVFAEALVRLRHAELIDNDGLIRAVCSRVGLGQSEPSDD